MGHADILRSTMLHSSARRAKATEDSLSCGALTDERAENARCFLGVWSFRRCRLVGVLCLGFSVKGRRLVREFFEGQRMTAQGFVVASSCRLCAPEEGFEALGFEVKALVAFVVVPLCSVLFWRRDDSVLLSKNFLLKSEGHATARD